MLAHAAIGAVVIVVPLVATDMLPRPASVMTLLISPQPDPPPIPPAPRSPSAATAPATPISISVSAAPRDAPATIQPEPEGTAIVPNLGPTVAGGGIGDSMGIVPGVVSPPPLPAVPTPPTLVRIGGHIRNPAKTRHVSPVYPPIALANRVEGSVTIEAIIGTDGRVQNASIVKSIPLLDQSALAAVMQWRFTPTLLNGVAGPVIMTVTVNFSLR